MVRLPNAGHTWERLQTAAGSHASACMEKPTESKGLQLSSLPTSCHAGAEDPHILAKAHGCMQAMQVTVRMYVSTQRLQWSSMLPAWQSGKPMLCSSATRVLRWVQVDAWPIVLYPFVYVLPHTGSLAIFAGRTVSCAVFIWLHRLQVEAQLNGVGCWSCQCCRSSGRHWATWLCRLKSLC